MAGEVAERKDLSDQELRQGQAQVLRPGGVPLSLRCRVSTWVTPVPTPPWTSSPERSGWTATMSFSPSGMMPLACPLRTLPSRTTSTQPWSPTTNIENFTQPAAYAGLLLRLGPGDRHHRPQATTSGPSGSSSSCSSTVWPTRPPCPSTGVPAVSACWPTKKWSTASASAAAAEVIRKEKSQWMLKITAYAQQLIDGLDDRGLHRPG